MEISNWESESLELDFFFFRVLFLSLDRWTCSLFWLCRFQFVFPQSAFLPCEYSKWLITLIRNVPMAPSRRVVPYQFAFVGFLFADTQIYEVSSIGPLVRQSVGP